MRDEELDFYDEARSARKLLDEAIDLCSLEGCPHMWLDRLEARWRKVVEPWVEELRVDLFHRIEDHLERLERPRTVVLLEQEEQA